MPLCQVLIRVFGHDDKYGQISYIPDFLNIPLMNFPLEYVDGSVVGSRNAMLTDLRCPVQFGFGAASCGHFPWRFLEQPRPTGG